MSDPRQLAEELTRALHRQGIVTYVTIGDYKDSPGPPVLEIMLTQHDAFKLINVLP